MWRRLTMIIAVMIMSGSLAGQAESADDNSCWLKAEQTLYLSIDDLDTMGNILAHLWEGVLEQGSKKLLKSSNGKIRYYTNPSGLSSSPGIDLTCDNNEIISVP